MNKQMHQYSVQCFIPMNFQMHEYSRYYWREKCITKMRHCVGLNHVESLQLKT